MSEFDLRELLDGNTQVFVVATCFKCPFYNNEDHPDALDWCDCERRLGTSDRAVPLPSPKYDLLPGNRVKMHPIIPPDTCPLRDRAVIVVVEAND